MPAPYLSEIKYLGNGALDFIEVALDAGASTAGIQVISYSPSGTVRSTDNLGTLDNTIAGTDVYVIDRATAPNFTGLHANGAIALVVGGTVTAFYSFNTTLTATNGPASGMTSTIIGTTGAGGSLESTDGVNYTATSTPTEGVVPCFLTGTLIATDNGPRPVETLKANDLIQTLDHGFQPLLWAGWRGLNKAERLNRENLPVMIPAGALGAGLPKHTLYVSPNHRILLTDPAFELLFCESEVLVTAKSLVGWRGARQVPLTRGLSYHHLLFEKHELVHSNGTISESLHLGHMAILGFSGSVRRALTVHLGNKPETRTARIVLKQNEAQIAMSCLDKTQVTLDFAA